MARGRKPKPRALKLLDGNPGNRPLPPEDGAPEAADLAAPKSLSAPGKEFWNRHAPILAAIGVVKETDLVALEIAARLFEDLERYGSQIQKEGEMVRTKKGVMVHPAVYLRSAARRDLLKWMSELGLTPASRVRIPTKAADKPQSMRDKLRLVPVPKTG